MKLLGSKCYEKYSTYKKIIIIQHTQHTKSLMIDRDWTVSPPVVEVVEQLVNFGVVTKG